MTGAARSPLRKWSLPFARVLGIEVRLHVTFVLLLALFASASTLTWLLMVFACVLVHELAHSVTARRRGAEVEEILLLPIGGVSRIRGLGDDARIEAWVAAVGPLMSLALAGTAALVATVFGSPLFPVDFEDGPVVVRLAWLNLLLGGFNLLPAFPMDGGRLLRAVLSLRYGPETATRVATGAGRALAFAMFVAGLYVNTWLVFIAVFVYLGAANEEMAAVVHARARGLRVEDVMLPAPLCPDAMLREVLADPTAPGLDPDDALDPTAFEALADSGHGAVAVVHGGQVVGLLRDEDILERLMPDRGG